MHAHILTSCGVLDLKYLIFSGVTRVWCFCILCVNQKSIKWTWAEPFEMNVKIIEQGSNFVTDNERRFFDA